MGKYYIPDSVEQSRCNNWVEGKRLVNDIGIEWDKMVNEMLYSFSF